ncbi:MAG TPA: hypothetical protein VMH27_08480 [Puia sp.]|nr:hypothetical protein [Puia sp.]
MWTVSGTVSIRNQTAYGDMYRKTTRKDKGLRAAIESGFVPTNGLMTGGSVTGKVASVVRPEKHVVGRQEAAVLPVVAGR